MAAPRVAVFTSIPNIGEALLQATCALNMDLQIITDDPALADDGGGTAKFDPSLLHETTRQALSLADILICEPSILAKLLQQDSQVLPCLKWCQLTFAGVDALLANNDNSHGGIELSCRLTRFAGVFGPPIAEWCLARIIGHERKFALSAVHQTNRQWTPIKEYRYLCDLTLSVLGCGDIGLCVARAAKAFGMRVIGHVKTPREHDDVAIDEYTADLSMALCEADYIVSVLPSTPETRGLLGGEALKAASRDAGGKTPVFINVGRGDVIDEASLIRALDCGYISAAMLDVFEKEPLPVESALWTRPDVVISPHVSGVTQAKDVPEVFLENYRRYLNGNDLLYEVDWSKGY